MLAYICEISLIKLLNLRNINLTLCGLHFGSKDYSSKNFSSALTIIQCKIVEINRMVIERSTGIGLMIFVHEGSRVNISSAIFKANQLTQHKYINSTVPSLNVWGRWWSLYQNEKTFE